MRVIFSHSFALLCLTLIMVTACAPKIANHGSILDSENLTKIVAGQSTREDVLDLLGTPTQVSTFDENTWYYISRKTEQYSFLDPEIVEQKSFEIQFDDVGLVTAMNDFDAQNAKTISPVSRRTPTYGKQTTFIEQLMGNVGRPGSLNKRK